MKIGIEVEDYQLRQLQEKTLLISKSLGDFKETPEITAQWEQFFFEIISELNDLELPVGILTHGEKLFDFLINNWYNIISKYHLSSDIKLYPDLIDFVTLDDWLKIKGHDVMFCNNKVILIQDKD